MGSSKAIIRSSIPSDVDRLRDLIVDSTSNRSKITSSGLNCDLFDKRTSHDMDVHDDPTIELDLDLIHSNRPICQALVAEVEGEVIGYIMFHYFYSPWIGRVAYIDDIYVVPSLRQNGIAKEMVQRLSQVCKMESVVCLLFNESSLGLDLKSMISRYGANIIRNDQTDWSVYRVSF